MQPQPPPYVRWVPDPSRPVGGYFVDATGRELPPAPTTGGGTRWVTDPSRPTGGYFVDATGRELPPAPVYNPSTGLWPPEYMPAPPAPAVPEEPSPSPPPDPLQTVLADWVARHGPLQGGAFTIDPEIEDEDLGRIPNPNPSKRYHFEDGAILEITDRGEIRGMKEPEVVAREGATRQSIREGRNVTETFRGGQWVVTAIGEPAVPEEGKPKEGDTRDSVREGRYVTETFRGGNWVVSSVGAEAVPGEAKPKEGDTRQMILEGRNVTQTYRGGQWVTTSIGDQAVPGAPREGQTRTAVVEGRNVTQTYSGGQWVTTSVGESAIPGQAKEGDTRTLIQEGRHVTQTYKGGQWVTTQVGAPAVPQAPTMLSTPGAEQQYQQRWDPTTGQVITELNPNYRPKESGARMQQLSQMAQAKLAELQGKISPQYSAQQAQTDFDRWWQATVEPAKADLQRQQDVENLAAAQTAMGTVQQGAQTGAGLLNQRVQAATGALNQINQLVGSNPRLTSIPAGLGPGLVSGLQSWVTGLGGGQGVYEAAANMVQQANPSLTGTGIGAQAASAISQILQRQANQRVDQGFGQYQPGAQSGFPGLERNQYQIGGAPPVAAPPPPQLAPAPVAGPAAPNLFHPTPIITTPEGGNPWRYLFPAYQRSF